VVIMPFFDNSNITRLARLKMIPQSQCFVSVTRNFVFHSSGKIPQLCGRLVGKHLDIFGFWFFVSNCSVTFRHGFNCYFQCKHGKKTISFSAARQVKVQKLRSDVVQSVQKKIIQSVFLIAAA
jgi:hypothetical protein